MRIQDIDRSRTDVFVPGASYRELRLAVEPEDIVDQDHVVSACRAI